MERPLLSVIIPTFNAATVLGGCLEALAQVAVQNHLEVLLMDGGSTDGTVALAQSFASRMAKLRVVCEPDKGIYDAMNKAMDVASGDWMIFLGADDRIMPEKLAHMLIQADAAGVDILQGDVVLANTGVRLARTMTPARLFTGEVFCHQAFCYRRALAPELRYSLDYPIAADQLFNWEWMIVRRAKLLHVHELLVAYANTGLSTVRKDSAWARDMPVWHGRIFPPQVIARRRRWLPVEKWGRKIYRYFVGRGRAKEAQLRLRDWLYRDAAGQ